MCMPVTSREAKLLTERTAWKVVSTRPNFMRGTVLCGLGPYRTTEFRTDGWSVPVKPGTDINDRTNRGYHVFRTQRHAENYKKEMVRGDAELRVAKVKIRGLALPFVRPPINAWRPQLAGWAVEQWKLA